MERRIAEAEVGDYWISTVALGVDLTGTTLLIDAVLGSNRGEAAYETMIFNPRETGWRDLYCERYETAEEALEGHQRVVEKVTAGELPDPGYDWITYERDHAPA